MNTENYITDKWYRSGTDPAFSTFVIKLARKGQGDNLQCHAWCKYKYKYFIVN